MRGSDCPYLHVAEVLYQDAYCAERPHIVHEIPKQREEHDQHVHEGLHILHLLSQELPAVCGLRQV